MRITWPDHCNTLQHSCDVGIVNANHVAMSLQHIATHCKTVQDECDVRMRITYQDAATHCNTLQHTAANQVARLYNTLQHTATHCNTLQHTATHCNTLERITWPDLVLVRGLQRVEYQIKYKSTHVFERSYHTSAKMVSSDFITW